MSELGAAELMRQALGIVKQGRLSDAEPLLARICELEPNNAKAWFLRGAIRAEFGDTNSAIECLSNTVRLDPDNTQAHFALCKLHATSGDPIQAIHHVETVVAQDPAHAHAWLALGGLYADSGQFERSERASRVAMELLPGVDEPKINLANALIAQDKGSEAINLCTHIKAQAHLTPGLWHSLGLAFKSLGKLQEAKQCLTTVLQQMPDDADALCALGEVNAEQGQLRQALSFYEQARDLSPADARVHFQIGKVLLPLCSAKHAGLVERLQTDHLYCDTAEARHIAKALVEGFRHIESAGCRKDDIELALVRFFDEFDPSRLYPADWWNDALTQFGDRRQAADTALRSIFSAVFSWSLPCQQAMGEVSAFCEGRLASYGSGSGYWEWLLATHHRVEVSCHDIALRHRFLPMHMTSHADALVDYDDTIFLAWIPGDATIDSPLLALLDRLRSGQKLVLVGEPADANGHPRTCGTQRFFRYLHENFDTVATVPLPNYAYLQDRVDLLVRR